MKSQITTLLTLTLLASLAACSKAAPNRISKSDAAADAFQQESIARVGLNMKLSLTFDDGPTTGTTEALLDLLAEENIKASFFLNGKNIPGREATVARMTREGHIVANHAQNHHHLPTVASDKGMNGLFDEVNETHRLILPYVQEGGRLYFRAPFGAWREHFAPFLNQDQILRNYIGPMFWDIGGNITRYPEKHPKEGQINFDADGSPAAAADWDCWSKPKGKQNLTVEQCTASYFKESMRRKGGIVLLHDISMQTVEMVRKLIPMWREAGFTFVTLDELPQLDQFR